jgi:prepilin-type N-terminal cleavage/methylation domain-containing protein
MRFGTIFNIFKSFSGQRGFTLPEIMIGGAIVAGVALAGATLFKNQSKEELFSWTQWLLYSALALILVESFMLYNMFRTKIVNSQKQA